VTSILFSVQRMPIFRGVDKKNGEKREIVRPRLASRLMSIFLAVYLCILQAKKTNSCAVLHRLARNLQAGPSLFRGQSYLDRYSLSWNLGQRSFPKIQRAERAAADTMNSVCLQSLSAVA
jgi:hypothetical protein